MASKEINLYNPSLQVSLDVIDTCPAGVDYLAFAIFASFCDHVDGSCDSQRLSVFSCPGFQYDVYHQSHLLDLLRSIYPSSVSVNEDDHDYVTVMPSPADYAQALVDVIEHFEWNYVNVVYQGQWKRSSNPTIISGVDLNNPA